MGKIANTGSGKCALTGLKMTFNKSLLAISVDRINNEEGYIPNNIQLVCRWVNLAKNSGSNQEFKDILKMIDYNSI